MVQQVQQEDPIRLEDVWELVGMLYMEAWALRKKIPDLQAQVTALTQQAQQLKAKATVLTVDRTQPTGEVYDSTTTGVSDAA